MVSLKFHNFLEKRGERGGEVESVETIRSEGRDRSVEKRRDQEGKGYGESSGDTAYNTLSSWRCCASLCTYSPSLKQKVRWFAFCHHNDQSLQYRSPFSFRLTGILPLIGR